MPLPLQETHKVHGVCPHDCPDTCAWTVTVRDGRAVELAGDPEHPMTRGGLCAKVNHYLDDRVYNPERLLHPLRRTGPKGSGEFEQVGLDEALDDIAARLRHIAATDGPSAVLPYSYMGTQGLIQHSSMDRRFFARFGATRLVRAVCGATGVNGVALTNGTITGVVPEDLVHSQFIVLWGTNTVVTNLHLWPIIRQAQAAGATVVVVDPLRTRTAAAADWHLRPLPGTDAALALGDAQEVVAFARAYASTRPSVIRLLIGIEHHARGAAAYRTIACLPALTGAWRDRGGGLAYLTAGYFFDALRADLLARPDLEDGTIRSVNMVQLGQALTEPNLEPPIRALVVYNSNPATIAPNSNLVRSGLAREDLFTVVHEQVLTDTARYADYVLPATTAVEHLDLLWSWGHTYLALNQPAIAAPGEALPNTELFRRLARRIGFDETCFTDSDEDLVRQALDSEHPHLAGISYESLQQRGWAPLNLPTEPPFAHGGFPTPTGKAELYSKQLAAAGLDPLPGYEPAAGSPAGDPELTARYPLQLLTPKSALHFLNSSYADHERHRRAEREPRVELHPDDAAARGITDGQPARAFNDRGSIELRARVGDRVRPGVVAIPSGWWASLSPGGTSANALTADGLSDHGGGGDFHDTLVEVEAP